MIKFFSFLGTNRYIPCNYYLGDVRVENDSYVQAALLKILHVNGVVPSKIVVFTTKKATEQNWMQNAYDKTLPGLYEALCNLDFIPSVIINNLIIPDGNNEKELWELFDIIMGEIDERDEIIFDITHSFRFLPMLAFIVLNYGRVVKKAQIKAVYYGAFETLGSTRDVEMMPIEKRNAPILDLTPFIDVFDWTLGVDRYLNTGDVSIIHHLTQTSVKEINSEISAMDVKDKKVMFRNVSQLKILAENMKKFSDVVFTCRGKELDKTALELKKTIDTVLESAVYTYLKPLSPVLNMLNNKFGKFGENNYDNLLNICEWCLDNRMYQQGLTLLEEGIISYLCNKNELNQNEQSHRDIISACSVVFHGKKLKQEYEKDRRIIDSIIQNSKNHALLKLLYSIASVRNDINHAGWRNNPGSPSIFEKQLRDFIDKARSIQHDNSESVYIKPRRMFLIISHSITPEQEKEARTQLGIDEFVMLEPNLLDKWSNIPPDVHLLDDHLEDVFKWIDKNACDGDYALVQGDYGATFMVVDYCMARGIIPVYATTQRKVKEEVSEDSIITTREFKHVMFREYKRRD
ncbi:CRISPR-associated protein, TM1812 family [Caldanaerobius fijiensis DSM 17918]|uniref:CRISPR-associated protein, TM1812 family n=1 Tax=Caldanaerobius fijiensis DSM 17918 TaxID=1121256 RepID=A0A1M4SLD1_9THEO|nr:CRISPR-associated protein Csx20 [Caldanaerobius fijiensis]SHE33016.1 CRISPR-associated protein, TM1812 family [Caldanaerobius fijiensis DSM 17918]